MEEFLRSLDSLKDGRFSNIVVHFYNGKWLSFKPETVETVEHKIIGTDAIIHVSSADMDVDFHASSVEMMVFYKKDAAPNDEYPITTILRGKDFVEADFYVPGLVQAAERIQFDDIVDVSECKSVIRVDCVTRTVFIAMTNISSVVFKKEDDEEENES
jgi:hypothetical protein